MVSFVSVATLTNQTFLITPRNAGQVVRFGGVNLVTTAEGPVRVYGSGAVQLSSGWWDQMLIVNGQYEGWYFDGDTPDSPASTVVGMPVHRYAWTGAVNASTSTWESGQVVSSSDEQQYLNAVEGMARYLHNVTCVSGPIVEQKLHRKNTWGYVVEFVLAAATPWVFGATRTIELPPSTPVVVQDVPFNLVPYPSAEISAGTVVAATNYSTNPSVEIDTASWAKGSTVVVAGDVVGSQADKNAGGLASVGDKSYRSRFTASNSGTNGTITAENTSATFTSTVAGQRMSVNMWASALITSGTAVISKTEVFAIWRNGSTVLRTDLIGTTPVGGGAITGDSIAVPVGTTNVIVQAKATLSSWSSGAVVDLYADAVAVTVP